MVLVMLALSTGQGPGQPTRTSWPARPPSLAQPLFSDVFLYQEGPEDSNRAQQYDRQPEPSFFFLLFCFDPVWFLLHPMALLSNDYPARQNYQDHSQRLI